jgi:hypothetical protein
MIQRIQSIYLFLAVVALSLLFYFPLANFSNNQDIIIFNLQGFSRFSPLEQIPTWPLLVINILSIALTAITIFLFKKRPLQIRLTRIALILNMGFIALTNFVYCDHLAKQLKMIVNYEFGFFLPVIALVFHVLAIYAINRDERLIKSIDRIR